MRYIFSRRNLAVIILSVFCSLALPSGYSSLYAADPADKLTEIKEKLKVTLQELTDVKMEEESVISKIENISANISDKEKELSQYDKRISQTRSQIESILKEIDSINDRLESSRYFLEEHIVALYKRQYNNDAMMLISADDYNELIRKSRYISLAAYHNNKVLNEYKNELIRINSRKEKLEELRAKLDADKADVSRKKGAFQTDLVKKDKLLAEVKARRAAQEKKMNDLEAASGKIRGMVTKLRAKKMPEAILGKGFSSQKGRLPWPVRGELAASFGKYRDAEFRLEGFRNGIEINAAAGEAARAIAGGRVVYADSFRGFGNMLIIDHGGGYHSLYGNLSNMALETGELVMHGITVGEISRAEDSELPVLYFEIRHKGRPLDPENWLE